MITFNRYAIYLIKMELNKLMLFDEVWSIINMFLVGLALLSSIWLYKQIKKDAITNAPPILVAFISFFTFPLELIIYIFLRWRIKRGK